MSSTNTPTAPFSPHNHSRRRPRRWSLAPLALLGLLGPVGSTLAAPPPNDDCATPDSIAGNGIFNFDLTEATTGFDGQNVGFCANGGMRNDVWFCWTAPCTGLIEIATCGLTLVDTRIAIYPAGCACPGDMAPACCNDNACGKESKLTCEVVCCEKYLIQIAAAPGALLGPGQFTINCLGTDCPQFPCGDPTGGQAPECGPCCGGRPSFTGFPGQISVITQHRYTATEPVVRAFDLSGPGLNPPGTLSTPPAYSHSSWTLANLGTVFGLALDDLGNVYATHTTSFYQDALGSGGAGAIYKLDSSTGVASVFATLPNNNIAGCFGTECRPGLGNVTYDCGTRNLYVSNFEDGRIYRLDSVGTVLSTFDHATGVISPGGAPEPGDANGFAPLGERVWAVEVAGPRLYYSTWAEDGGRPSTTAANEIWSIALDGAGQFIGAAQLEFVLPPYPFSDHSNPVSDIIFDGDCCMIVAERTMSDDTSPGAHQSRDMQFCFDAAAAGWTAGPATWTVGAIGLENSSAGGVAIDFSTGGLLWATGDALQFSPDVIYGMAGLPLSGGNNAGALLVDFDSETTQQDKTQIGDVVIPCVTACMAISDVEVDCELVNGLPNGDYTLTFTVTNTSGVTAQYLLFPSVAVSPNVLPLVPPLANGATTTVSVSLSGLDPSLALHCIQVVLADAQVQACCHTEVCFTLPDCTCMLMQVQKLYCLPGTGGSFQVWFAYIPLSFSAEFMFIAAPLPPDPNSGALVSPAFIDVSTPMMTPGFAGPITVSGAAPGSEICLTVTIHSESFGQCCSKALCFEVPYCMGDACPGDANGDGVVDGADLGLLLAGWGGNDPMVDLNSDGIVDGADLGLLLAAWGICG